MLLSVCSQSHGPCLILSSRLSSPRERRENDLREAYRLARTPEEAALVLHRYAQRFTISEAVLERLQLPKLLDRSVSEDPTTATSTRLPLTPTSRSPNSTSPEEDPNGPLKYLRQQSLPAPKFTATVEAQVAGFPQGQSQRPQIQSRTPEPNPSFQAASPKSVPLLTPKPYIQSKGTQMLAGPKPGKVRHKMQANGEKVLAVLSLVYFTMCEPGFKLPGCRGGFCTPMTNQGSFQKCYVTNR